MIYQSYAATALIFFIAELPKCTAFFAFRSHQHTYGENKLTVSITHKESSQVPESRQNGLHAYSLSVAGRAEFCDGRTSHNPRVQQPCRMATLMLPDSWFGAALYMLIMPNYI